jgi:hypothetical protein
MTQLVSRITITENLNDSDSGLCDREGIVEIAKCVRFLHPFLLR